MARVREETDAPTEMTPDERIARIERENAALRKTCRVLKQRMKASLNDPDSHFARFESQAQMQQIVDQRTAEILDQAEQTREENRQRARVEALLNDALRLAQSGGWMYDLHTESMQLTGEFRRILEIPDDAELTIEDTLEFYHQDLRDNVEAALAAALGSQIPFDLEGRLTTSGGREIWVRVQARVYTEDGRASRILGLISDITERKLAESRSAQAHKMESVGQLASGIAHEINTPTQFVRDNVQFLKGAFRDLRVTVMCLVDLVRSTGDETLGKRADEALEAADFEYLDEEVPLAVEQALEGLTRVARLVGAMKDYAHPGSEQKQLADLNRAIESTVTVARNEWKYVAEVKLELDPDLPEVPCYLADLNQVVLNMIVNAAHAIDERYDGAEGTPGRIRIATRRDAGRVRISIRDNGNGIPDEIRTRVYDPFFTTKDVGKGTGQGLSISHSVIVDQHHGEIELETEVGVGTEFHLWLPLPEEAL